MITYDEGVAKSEIYLYTLSLEGENPFYIGQTNKPDVRYKLHLNPNQHHGNKKKVEIIQAALSSGKQILMRVFLGCDKSEWKKLERYWICKYKYDWQIKIVNISDGGNAVDFTEEVISKMSQARKGKPLSQNTRNKMKGRNVWNKGKKIHNTKKVEQLNESGDIINVFDSIKQAGEKLNLNRGSLSLVVNGKRHTLNGYRFRYSSN